MNNNDRKVIGLVVNKMSENDNDLFLIPKLRKANFLFELYDLSPLVHGVELNKNYADNFINSFEDLEYLVNNNKDFIIYFGDSLKEKKIFNIFRKIKNKNYYIINNSVIGVLKDNKSFVNKFFKLLINPKSINEHIYIKFSRKLVFHDFVSGTSNSSTEIPSYEYENFLKVKSERSSPEKKYHIFLDQNLCYHRDLKDLRYKLVHSPSEYFSTLNLFFNELERRTGKRVVIAMHPRANPELYSFGDRELVFGKTDKLVSEADLVLGHFSTAIHYALLFEKDLLLLTMDTITDFGNKFINDFSRILKIPSMNISNENNFENYINHAEYNSYVRRYIASDSVILNHNSASEIIIKYINNLENTA